MNGFSFGRYVARYRAVEIALGGDAAPFKAGLALFDPMRCARPC
jgi:hypothetical protein